jgi:hypothetical protein
VSVVFYISGHGFGHASRQVEVINALGALTREPIVIRSDANPRLLQRTLAVPYTLRPGACDSGIVQTSSIEQDDEATVEAALEFYAGFDRRADAEVRQLREADVRLVVGDIPPLAFETAHRLGVPSVAISNFTWDWIYAAHPGFLPRGESVLDTMRAAYRRATLALELPFPGGFDIFPTVEPIPLVARRPRHRRETARAHFGLPAAAPVALLSFGGYGLPRLHGSANDWAEAWTVVTTDRLTGDAPHRSPIVIIGDDTFPAAPYGYEDLVVASDVVITKPGYGIVSECIATGTAMVYTSRGAFREYEIFARDMPRTVRCRFMSHDDLFAGRWRAALDAAVALPAPPERMDPRGAGVAAAKLAGMLGA